MFLPPDATRHSACFSSLMDAARNASWVRICWDRGPYSGSIVQSLFMRAALMVCSVRTMVATAAVAKPA